MASCTHRITYAITTAASPTITTAAFTPAAGELLVVLVMASGTVAVGAMTGTQQGQTFTMVASSAWGTNTNYVFISNNLADASSMTVTYDATGDPSTGQAIVVYGVSGMSKTGAGAYRQYDSSAGASGTTPAVTFSLFGLGAVLTGNPTLCLVGNSTSPATITPPTGWTEPTGVPNSGTGVNGDTGYATPTSGCETCFRDSGFTGTTITWGSTSATAWGALVIELDTSSAAAFNKPVLQAVNRASTY